MRVRENLGRGMSCISGIRLQTVDDAQENASWYGECASGRRIYAYADSDPLNLTDPSGNCPWCIAGAIGAVVGGGVEIIANKNWIWTSLAIAAGSGFVAGASGSGAVALVGKAISLAGGTGAAAAITSEAVGSGLASSAGNLTSQVVQNVTGQQQGISAGELGLSTPIRNFGDVFRRRIERLLAQFLELPEQSMQVPSCEGPPERFGGSLISGLERHQRAFEAA